MSANISKDIALQEQWLKKNKPNSYFDTIEKKSIDKLIGVFITYKHNGEDKTEKIIKRRTCKKEKYSNGDNAIVNEYHYFTDSKFFTLDEVLELLETSKNEQ